jgi:uncharacterized protein (DUF2062 family)
MVMECMIPRKNIKPILKNIKSLLLKGLTPKKLALTLAIGTIIGLFPIIGTTTFMAGVAAYGLGLNQAFIQIVNYTLYPIQLILFIPFLKWGIIIFPLGSQETNIQSLTQLLHTNLPAAFGEFSYILMAAILLWFFLAVPLSLCIYYVSLRYIRKIKN